VLTTLKGRLPTADALLALTVKLLAWHLLELARQSAKQGEVNIDVISTVSEGTGAAARQVTPYEPARQHEVQRALNEAWYWLSVNMLVIPAPLAIWPSRHVLTRRAESISIEEYATRTQRDW
jgi:hypothetical protein